MQQAWWKSLRCRVPVFAVLVSGPSMVPTLRDGECVLVRRRANVQTGAIVVARFRVRPDLLVVKRAVRQVDGGWWIEGDNPLVTDDSRRYGVADVVGQVLARYWPVRRARLFRSGARPRGAGAE